MKKKIRFLACGEYGTDKGRPHYHVCAFGLDFKDKTLYQLNDRNPIFTSALLDDIWTHGDSKIGSVTFKSVAYVARYICEKKLGKEASYYDDEGIHPEFARMSLKPGLGATWYDRYGSDVFPHDYMVVNGSKCKPPRYFSILKEREDLEEFTVIKENRMEQASKKDSEYYDLKRLRAKEAIKKAQLAMCKRKL